MISQILALIVYFDSECTNPAVKVEHEDIIKGRLGRRINVIRHYKLINGECKLFIGDEILRSIKHVKT